MRKTKTRNKTREKQLYFHPLKQLLSTQLQLLSTQRRRPPPLRDAQTYVVLAALVRRTPMPPSSFFQKQSMRPVMHLPDHLSRSGLLLLIIDFRFLEMLFQIEVWILEIRAPLGYCQLLFYVSHSDSDR